MKKISGIFLAVLTFFSSTLNVFADTIEVFEEKTETIDKKDYDKYKEELEKKVLELNEQDDDYVYDYEVTIKEEKDEVIITEKETISSQEKFTSIEEAKKFYDEYNLEDAWKKGKLTITSQDEDIKINGNEITIYCEDSTCEDEIATLEESLNQYQELEVIQKETTSKDDTKTIVYSIDGKEKELTAEEAAQIIVTYKPEVEGYNFIKNEAFLTRKGKAELKTYQELYGDVTFETEEAAQQALQEFLSRTDYENITGIVASFIDTDATIIENYSTSGYLTKELAEQAALSEINISLNGSTIIVSDAYEKEIKDIEEIKNMEFENEKEAAEYLAERLAEGYVSSNIKYEKGEQVSSGKSTIETQIKKSNNEYRISKDSNYVLIDEQDKDNLIVWTRTEWSNKQKEEFKKSAISNHHHITENTTITYITGYKTFDMSYLGKKWSDEYTFTEESLKADKTADTIKAYEGKIETYNKVLLNCTLTKTNTLWYVDLQKTTLDYDYAIVGGASTIQRDLFKVQSILTGKIYTHTMAYRVNTINTYTSYVSSFDIYKETIKTNATVEYKITREKAATGSTNGLEDGEQITPPNTGAESNLFLSLGLLALLAGAISLKKLCK